MELDEIRLVALVNRLTDAFLPSPDGPEPVGPWGRWIREALDEGPHPEPWKNGPVPDPWIWRAAAHAAYGHLLADLAGLVRHVDDYENPSGGRRPRPNWALRALLRDLASLNPQSLPPVNSGVVFARNLAYVALRRARDAGSEQGGSLLGRFSDDWCGTLWRPFPPKPGEPGEPRPPRPEESLVLGATLIRAAGSSEFAALREAAEGAGRRIFTHGFAGMA